MTSSTQLVNPASSSYIQPFKPHSLDMTQSSTRRVKRINTNFCLGIHITILSLITMNIRKQTRCFLDFLRFLSGQPPTVGQQTKIKHPPPSLLVDDWTPTCGMHYRVVWRQKDLRWQLLGVPRPPVPVGGHGQGTTGVEPIEKRDAVPRIMVSVKNAWSLGRRELFLFEPFAFSHESSMSDRDVFVGVVFCGSLRFLDPANTVFSFRGEAESRG